jgi:hypothetical protein
LVTSVPFTVLGSVHDYVPIGCDDLRPTLGKMSTEDGSNRRIAGPR